MKREKTVFASISDVCHKFANLETEKIFDSFGKAGNVYFENGAIYSYGRHFAIARYAEQNRRLYVLFSTDTYSVSTSSHQSEVRHAMSHYDFVFVPRADNSPRQNFDAWQAEAKTILFKLSRARKPALYLDQISSLENSVKIYAKIFGLTIPKELKRLLSVKDGAQYAAILQKEAKERDKRAKEAARAQAKKDAEELASWRNFEKQSVYISNGFSYLRYNPDKERIETSKAVQIPVKSARRLYEVVKHTIDTQKTNGLADYKILDFRVKGFDFERHTLEVGCHSIPQSEIEAVARQLQW